MYFKLPRAFLHPKPSSTKSPVRVSSLLESSDAGAERTTHCHCPPRPGTGQGFQEQFLKPPQGGGVGMDLRDPHIQTNTITQPSQRRTSLPSSLFPVAPR
ncbi:unnamed protein product [Gadus morhua 'NCC']